MLRAMRDSTCIRVVRAGSFLGSFVLLLACGGLMGPGASQGTKPTIRPNPDAKDMAERARLMRDYLRAETILKDRIRTDPTDHHAHRLLGDVNLTRGADYQKKWKENLGRAFDAYSRAVGIQPENCSYWARLAGTATMASMNPATRLPPSTYEALPLKEGWANCSGPALVELELLRDPTPEDIEVFDEDNPRASPYDRIQELQPWVVEAWQKVPYSHVSWIENDEEVSLQGGLPFVVLEPPLEAVGVGHTYHRAVNGVERFTTGRVAGDRVIFTDRRFPKKLPREAIVKAPACRHSSWRNNETTGVATGSCSTSGFIRGKSPLYDPASLVSAGAGHYTVASTRRAVIPADEVLYDSIRCLGGPIGKKFEYTPSCKVAYDKPNWLQRSLPIGSVVPAKSAEHADRMIQAKGMQPIWGDELTERMIRGDLGIGMPYAIFRYALDDLKGCQGRSLLTGHMINGGELEWTCRMGDRAYTFIDLQLAWMGSVEEYDQAMAQALDPGE